MSVQLRPDLGDYSIHAGIVSGCSCHLPFKVWARVGLARRHIESRSHH